MDLRRFKSNLEGTELSPDQTSALRTYLNFLEQIHIFYVTVGGRQGFAALNGLMVGWWLLWVNDLNWVCVGSKSPLNSVGWIGSHVGLFTPSHFK